MYSEKHRSLLQKSPVYCKGVSVTAEFQVRLQAHVTQSHSSKFSGSLHFIGILGPFQIAFSAVLFCPPFWGRDTRLVLGVGLLYR